MADVVKSVPLAANMQYGSVGGRGGVWALGGLREAGVGDFLVLGCFFW